MTPQEMRETPPKCPHCGVQPCMVGMNPISFGGGAMAGVFICKSCREILGVAPLPSINLPDQPPMIVRPS
jgi:hypothetical protein